MLFEGTNELTLTYLKDHPPQGQPRRSGIIVFDYPGADLLDYIISANHPPKVTVSPSSQTGQQGEEISVVTFTATDIARDSMTAAAIGNLPDGLQLTSNGCTFSSGIQTCEWILEGTLNQQDNYDITVTVTDKNGGTGTGVATILDHWEIFLPTILR